MKRNTLHASLLRGRVRHKWAETPGGYAFQSKCGRIAAGVFIDEPRKPKCKGCYATK